MHAWLLSIFPIYSPTTARNLGQSWFFCYVWPLGSSLRFRYYPNMFASLGWVFSEVGVLMCLHSESLSNPSPSYLNHLRVKPIIEHSAEPLKLPNATVVSFRGLDMFYWDVIMIIIIFFFTPLLTNYHYNVSFSSFMNFCEIGLRTCGRYGWYFFIDTYVTSLL